MINAVLGKKAQDEMSDMKQQLTIKEVLVFFWLLYKRSSCRELDVKGLENPKNVSEYYFV